MSLRATECSLPGVALGIDNGTRIFWGCNSLSIPCQNWTRHLSRVCSCSLHNLLAFCWGSRAGNFRPYLFPQIVQQGRKLRLRDVNSVAMITVRIESDFSDEAVPEAVL